MHIFLFKDRTQTGPFTEEQARGMIADGAASVDDLARLEGVRAWGPLGQVLGQSVALPEEKPDPISAGPSPRRHRSRSDRPTGVGGWLLFFCVMLILLIPASMILAIGTLWYIQVSQGVELAGPFRTLQIILFTELAVVIVYGMLVGVTIWRGNPRGREIAKTYLVIRFILAIAVAIAALVLRRAEFSTAGSNLILQLCEALSASTIFFLLWWYYFKVSARVRNTYGGEVG